MPRPHHKVLEEGIELNVLLEDLNDLWEGYVPGVQHLLEGIAEGVRPVEDGLVALKPLLEVEAVVVGYEVIGVFEGDFAVKVGEEDDLGAGLLLSISGEGIPSGLTGIVERSAREKLERNRKGKGNGSRRKRIDFIGRIL